MKIVLSFRDIRGELDPLDIKFKVLDHLLAKNWLSLFKKNVLQSTHPIEKTYCLMNWQTWWISNYSRNLKFLCKKLNQSIKIINESMNPLGYPLINLNFSVEQLKERNQEMLNEIHHHFEILIGQLWSTSEWYKITPDDKTRTAIRMLNNYCHEIEGVLRTIEYTPQVISYQQKLRDVHHPLAIHVNLNGIDNQGNYFAEKDLKYLTAEEFNCFQDNQEWGDVIIYYAQLGKTHLEAFFDKDEFIDRKNISSYQTLTGEAVFSFNCLSSRIRNEFIDWCHENNFDLNDKTLGIGYPIVAKVENTFNSKVELSNALRARDDLYKISLENDNGIIELSRIFDYTWQDEERWKDEHLFGHG